MEKIVTKSLCKVLEGLALNESIQLPDAIKIIDDQMKERLLAHPEKQGTEFSALLDELIGKTKNEEIEDDSENEEEDVAEEEN